MALLFNGAHENGVGNVFCDSCGSPMKRWEKMATLRNERGQVYVFRCQKCKKRIEVTNTKG